MANVGTATVMVVPSMSGFGSKLESGLSSAFGSASATASKSGSSAGTAFSGGLMAKMGAIGGIAGSIASSAMSVIGDSISSAVSRVDTLNQFPKVMQQMGFSAESAQASIDTLSAGIEGLPTSLDAIASSTQSIALLTGDLDGATSTALALNDAFLASGSSTADAERGLTQYTQMLSKGSVDLQSWRTLQETMGYALRETAEAMGYTGDSAVNDLYAALQSGEVTFDEFNAKLVELDQAEGGFASTAATASSGIQTSMDNAKTAVVKNVANIIQAFNETGMITGFFDGLKTVINGLGEILTPIASLIGEQLSTGFQRLAEAAEPLRAKLEEMLPAAQPLGDFFMNTLSVALEAVFNVLIAGVNAIIVVIDAFTQLYDGVTTAMSDISATVSSAWNTVTGLFNYGVNTIRNLWNLGWSTITSVLTGAWSTISTGVSDGISTMVSFVSDIPGKITGALGDLGSLLYSAGQNVIQGLINGITGMVSSAVSAVTDAVGSVVEGAKSALGIASPSKVFKQIGYYVDAGLAVGIGKYAKNPISAAAKLASDVAGAGSASLSFGAIAGGSYATGGASGAGRTVVQNFQNKIVRSDADLYSAATIINSNALRLAGA